MNQLASLTGVRPNVDDIMTSLQARMLAKNNAWKDLYVDGVGETLLEFVALITEYNQATAEAYFGEGFSGTAQRDSSQYEIAAMQGGRITRKIPGSITCELTRAKTDGTVTGNDLLTVPKFSSFLIGTTTYFNREDIIFSPYQAKITVILYEGQVNAFDFVSDGKEFQQFEIPSLSPMSLSDSDLLVIVGTPGLPVESLGYEWKVISNGLWNYTDQDAVVYEATLGTGDIQLTFGNGFNGKIPAATAPIRIKVVETLGSKSPVVPTGTKLIATDPLSVYSITGVVVGTDLAPNYNLTLTALTGIGVNCDLSVGEWDPTAIGLRIEAPAGGTARIVAVVEGTAIVDVISAFKELVLVNVEGNHKWGLYTNSLGLDEKPASYYKVLAPQLFRSNGRGVTSPDYKAEIKNYPGVSDTRVIAERDAWAYVKANPESGIVPSNKLMSAVWICLQTTSGVLFTEEQWDTFVEWLVSRVHTNIHAVRLDPVPDLTDVRLDIFSKPLTATSTVASFDALRLNAISVIQQLFLNAGALLDNYVATSDISDKLRENFPDIDHLQVLDYATGLPVLGFTPTPTSFTAEGIPQAPHFLKLRNLVVNVSQTTRT